MTTLALDEIRTQPFSERMLSALNGAATMLMASIGHRTGLFDVMDGAPPSTAAEIAARAGLNERYVREWLAAMTTAGVVELDEAGRHYSLPAEHAAWLARSAGAQNLAVAAQWVAVLGGVEDAITRCFREGGGVPYPAYPRFHEVMAEVSSQTVLSSLLDAVLPLVPGLAERLRAGIHVLDVGCGRGQALLLLAAMFPDSLFTGYDASEQAVLHGWADAARQGLGNVRFEVRDAAAVDEPGTYDLITAFDAIHDQPHPDRVLHGIARSLRPGGVFLMQEIRAASGVRDNLNHPLGPFLYTISTFHCMSVSLAAGGLGLGTCWGREQALRMLRQAGFGAVRVHQLEHDFLNDWFVARLESR